MNSIRTVIPRPIMKNTAQVSVDTIASLAPLAKPYPYSEINKHFHVDFFEMIEY